METFKIEQSYESVYMKSINYKSEVVEVVYWKSPEGGIKIGDAWVKNKFK